MGKVSMFLIAFGLVFLVSAVVLTIISVIFPAFIPNAYNFVKAFVVGLLYVIAFGFIVLDLIIVKRDSE
jgi:hypothetical protein